MSTPAARLHAWVGATIIDGTGRPPIASGTLLTQGENIIAVGTAAAVPVPSDAEVHDLTGRYLLPGFMDGNVHLVPWPSWTYIEFLARYEGRFDEVAVEGAQLALRAGFTTVFDSMGPLDALIAARERIANRATPGARLLVAGNIVGFRAVFTSAASMASASRSFQKRINDRFEAGGGPDLAWKSPSQIRDQMSRYIAQGVDFVKYGATGDGAPVNSEIGQAAVLRFSPDQQRAIIDAGHEAGVIVQTHTTSAEALHISVVLGADMGQHAAMTGPSRMYEETIALMLKSGYHCGTQWGPLTDNDRRRVTERDFAGSDAGNGLDDIDFGLENAVRLLDAGVPQVLSTDAGWIDPDVALDPDQWGGLGGAASRIGEAEFLTMSGMHDRGMTPMQIIQATTSNVAAAYKVDDRLGSLEPGKIADCVVLSQDPLQNIAHMREIVDVIQSGDLVNRQELPTHHVLTKAT